MSAFEACPSDLIEARPWWGSDQEAELEPHKILTNICDFEAFSSDLEAELLRGLGAEPPGKF